MFSCLNSCSDGSKSSGNVLPSAAQKALQGADRFELLSLNPDELADKTDTDAFHGWNVLGTTEVKDPDTRANLISRFKAGVAENDGTVANCFNPRHGIKVTHDGETHEFVICFECFSVEWHVDGQETKGFLITRSPQPTFDEILKESGVLLAGEAKPE
jgi:hypothetical protein